MKEFDSIVFDKAAYERELSDYEQLLQSQTILSENKDILPFFKENRQLLAHIGKSILPDVFPVNRIANEYHLYGDLVCDAVIGNSQTQTYCFIEFEDASENSLFIQKRHSIIDSQHIHIFTFDDLLLKLQTPNY